MATTRVHLCWVLQAVALWGVIARAPHSIQDSCCVGFGLVALGCPLRHAAAGEWGSRRWSVALGPLYPLPALTTSDAGTSQQYALS
jgi:hypothetical protein